jgi:transposase-like protein
MKMKDELKKKTAKRYTQEEKQEILALVEKVNTEKGRGGVTAAVREYGVSPITVNSWLRNRKEQWYSVPLSKNASQVEVFQRLADLHSSIEDKRQELADMEKEYKSLKSRIQ